MERREEIIVGLRERIRRDAESMRRLMLHEEWAPVMFIAGAVVEGMLLAALLRRCADVGVQKVKKASFGISGAMLIARAEGLISTDLKKDLQWFGKTRNRIHPANGSITKGDAQRALEILQRLAKELDYSLTSPRPPKTPSVLRMRRRSGGHLPCSLEWKERKRIIRAIFPERARSVYLMAA